MLALTYGKISKGSTSRISTSHHSTESLPGYTGRLAISTGNSTKDFSGNFEIKPGYQTQIVQLNNAAELKLTTEHFYVQVIGENSDGNPSFANPGAGPGKLQTRPAKYVPIKVPVFNELATLDAQNALRGHGVRPYI